MLKFITLAALLTTSVISHADDKKCVIMITRTPCPGEKVGHEAMDQYGGQLTKEKPNKAKTKEECIKMTEEFAKIDRKPLFTKKVAVGTWEGVEVKTATDTNDPKNCKPEPK